MIIFKYLFRELVTSTLSIASVLVLVLISGRALKYLGDVSSGELLVSTLLPIILFRLPELLNVILPLSLFVAVLFVYGRMYLENEMAVLFACGVSPNKLLAAALVPAFLLLLVVGFFSVYLSPLGASKIEMIFNDLRTRSDFEMLTPGQFHTLGRADHQRVMYAETVSESKKILENVFISDLYRVNMGGSNKLVAVVAKRGEKVINEKGEAYFRLFEGFQYSGQPGDQDFRKVAFETYEVKMSESAIAYKPHGTHAWPTAALFEDESLAAQAEWQWRISLPLLIPLIVFMAVPLSRVNPRQGRYYKLFPAIILYLLYLGLLIASKSWVEKGKLSVDVGLWWVHGLFMLIALFIWFSPWALNVLTDWRRKKQVDLLLAGGG